MRLGWGHDDGAFFFSRPDAAQQECCEPGFTLLCMGLFSRFFVQALPCTAEGTALAVSSSRTSRQRGPTAGWLVFDSSSRSIFLLSMITGQALRVCPEGKPVPTHRVVARGYAFPDQALKPKISSTLSVLLMERARLAKA